MLCVINPFLFLSRYSVQMLTPAKIIAETCSRRVVSVQDVKEVESLFFDAKKSAKIISGDEGYMN